MVPAQFGRVGPSDWPVQEVPRGDRSCLHKDAGDRPRFGLSILWQQDRSNRFSVLPGRWPPCLRHDQRVGRTPLRRDVPFVRELHLGYSHRS